MTEKQKPAGNGAAADKLDSIGALLAALPTILIISSWDCSDTSNWLDTTSLTTNQPLLSRQCTRVLSRAKDLTQQLLTFAKGGAPMRKTSHFGRFLQELQVCAFGF